MRCFGDVLAAQRSYRPSMFILHLNDQALYLRYLGQGSGTENDALDVDVFNHAKAAFAYAKNTTRAENRKIIAHINDRPMLVL